MIKNCSNCGFGIHFACQLKREYVCDKHTFPQNMGCNPIVYIATGKAITKEKAMRYTQEAVMSHVVPITPALQINTMPEEMTEFFTNYKKEALLKSDGVWAFDKVTADIQEDIDFAKENGIPVYHIDTCQAFPNKPIVYDVLQTAYHIGLEDDYIKITHNPEYTFLAFINDNEYATEAERTFYDLSSVPEEERSYLSHRLENMPFGLYMNEETAECELLPENNETSFVFHGQTVTPFAYIRDQGRPLPSEYHPFSKLFYEDMNETIIEWCPHCEQEVEISPYGMSKCPSCGEEIRPCSSCVNCTILCPWGPKNW